MKKMVAKLVLFSVLFLMGSSVIASEAPITVEAEGMGRNRDEAMISAKRAAVEKGIGTIIHSETEIKNFMVNKDVILTRTVGAVESVEVLSESGVEADGNITIKIRATVSVAQIKDDLLALQILLESMQKPRVMVLIDETNMEDASSQVAETEILNYLSEKGFNLVDPGAVEQFKNHEQAMQAMEGNVAAAAVIGSEAGADMIIVGKASSQVAENVSVNLGGMLSCQANISMRVITVATASVVTAKTEQAAAVHISPQTGGSNAIAKAARKSMDEHVLDKIIGTWQDAINNGIPLRIVVSDVKAFASSKAVVKDLESVSGVVRVTNRGWNQGTGVMELEILYKGNTYGLCDAVDGVTLGNGASLAVTGVTANSARLKYNPTAQ